MNAGNGMGGIMPNWCSNHLTVKGEREEVQTFKEKAVGHNPWDTPPPDEKPSPLNFHSLVPIPENILQGKYENAGYGWEIANWGCRSGASDAELVDDNGSELFYGFDTVWDPPTTFLKHLGKYWPNLKFLLEYEDPAIDVKGMCKIHGEIFEDHRITF
jgi:Ferredoxin-like domain in Api92-like protein